KVVAPGFRTEPGRAVGRDPVADGIPLPNERPLRAGLRLELCFRAHGPRWLHRGIAKEQPLNGSRPGLPFNDVTLWIRHVAPRDPRPAEVVIVTTSPTGPPPRRAAVQIPI